MDSLNMIESLLDLSSHSMLLLGDSALVAFLGKLSAIGKVILGLGFVIFIHELGHFLAAKTFGVRCDKFYIGFDVPIKIGPIRFPSTLGKFQWGETEYGIGIIPLGGYVKMLGQDDDPRKAKEEADKVREGGNEAQPLDPRSFPAKPVWQRMIIISAGVVMNLISAVFLAGAAYFYGVPYTPAIVGEANAGGPAWSAGLQPGDQITRVGLGSEDPKLRYQDMFQNIVLGGMKAKGEPVEVAFNRNGQTQIINTFPSTKYDPDKSHPLLGFLVERSTVLSTDPSAPFAFINAKELGLQPGDRIVAVDGETLPLHWTCNVSVSAELTKRLAAKWNQPVKLTIERTGKPDAATASDGKSNKEPVVNQVEITLPPVPVKDFGIGFAFGSVTAVRPGSAGEKSGFQVGDKILAIDGEHVVDAFELPYQFASRAGKEVAFTVERGSEQLEFKVQSPTVPTFDLVSRSGSGELALGGVGVAFGASPIVSRVDSQRIKDGSIKVGDRLKQYRWEPTEAQLKDAEKIFSSDGLTNLTTSKAIDDYRNLPSLIETAQDLAASSKFNFDIERDGAIVSASVTLDYVTDRFLTDSRGLEFEPLTQVHKTDSLTEAMSLGLWETKRRFFDVLDFLKMMLSGNVSVKNVAGPITLVRVATSEASFGTSRLLLFLVLLSANLAILNFLPIPALDGGHMLFLTWEAIRGKPVDEDVQIKLTMAGVLGLLALMAFVILNDITRL